MDFKMMKFEIEGRIAIITLNRPKSMNALNSELLKDGIELLKEINSNKDIGAVIVTGSEKFFAAGADILEVANIHSVVDVPDFIRLARGMINGFSELNQPTIAAVAGLALGGGCELALACDMRIAAENAIFGVPEIKLGLLPGAGGTQRLPRLVGEGRAMQLMLTGDPIDASEAFRIGLVNSVVSADALLNEARKLANKIAAMPGYAVTTIKHLVNEGVRTDMNSAMALELKNFEILFATEDKKEGVRAFIEKRKPVFSNR